jgi:hypothetical protein
VQKLHLEPETVPETPTLLDGVERAGGAQTFQDRETRSSAGAGLEHTSYSVTDTISGGDIMTNRIFEEGTLEATARLREQDDEFCRRLRIAVEMGTEFCPTTVSTEPCTNRPILNYMRPD